MPFFSVIIPLFNKETFIEATLKSVLEQRFTDFEIIIINDGSTDNSENVIAAFDDTRIRYFTKENQEHHQQEISESKKHNPITSAL